MNIFWTSFCHHFVLKRGPRGPGGLQTGTQGSPKRYSGNTCRLNIFLEAFWTPFLLQMGRRGSYGTPDEYPRAFKQGARGARGPPDRAPRITKKIFRQHLSPEYLFGRFWGAILSRNGAAGIPWDPRWSPNGLQTRALGAQIEAQGPAKRYSSSSCRLNTYLDLLLAATWSPYGPLPALVGPGTFSDVLLCFWPPFHSSHG